MQWSIGGTFSRYGRPRNGPTRRNRPHEVNDGRGAAQTCNERIQSGSQSPEPKSCGKNWQEKVAMKPLFSVLLLSALSFGQTAATQDAAEMEAQYGTCAKHSIPADKCTPEIYQQLKAKDNASLDPVATVALKAVKEYQSRLKNPASMQLQTAYVTDQGAVCLEIGAQNGLGGISVSRVAYITPDWTGAKRLKEHWLDESGFGGSASGDLERMRGSGYEADRWDHVCIKSRKLLPGKDVTEKVNQALKR
jgi:hypothetical protein